MSESHAAQTLTPRSIIGAAANLLYAICHADDYRKLAARDTAKPLVALTSWPLTSIQKLARTRRRLTAMRSLFFWSIDAFEKSKSTIDQDGAAARFVQAGCVSRNVHARIGGLQNRAGSRSRRARCRADLDGRARRAQQGVAAGPVQVDVDISGRQDRTCPQTQGCDARDSVQRRRTDAPDGCVLQGRAEEERLSHHLVADHAGAQNLVVRFPLQGGSRQHHAVPERPG